MDYPESYQESCGQTWKDGVEYLEEIRHTLQWAEKETILDIGCGPGNFTAQVLLKMAPRDASVVGCDISEKMIDFANGNFKSPRVSFKLMDVESENIWDSWAKESFTKIYSLYCFHWIDKYRAAAANMHSLLKPGGEIHLMFLAEHKIFRLLTDIRQSEPYNNFIKGKTYFKRETNESVEERKIHMEQELKIAGFEDVKIETKECEYCFSSLDQFIELMLSVDPYRKYVPDDLLEGYSKNYVERVSNFVTLSPENGRARLQYSLFVVRAKKK